MVKSTSDDNKFNFTKAAINALPIPPKRKRSYYYDTHTRGLGISITDKGSKSFIVYRWVNGKPERVTLGRFPDISIEQARGKAAEVNSIIAKGENPNDKRRAERAEITLRELFDEYLERHAKLFKEDSWEEDEAQYNRYLVGWRNRKLSRISKNDIDKLHKQIGEDNGKYAANRLLSLLSVMFNKAIEWGLWEKANPVTGIERFSEKSRERFLQSTELPNFFKALSESSNETIRDYILLSLFTGIRKSNVLSMRWQDLHLVVHEWHIPKTKNKTSQIVTLTKEAVEILQKREKQQDKNSIYVFPSYGKKGHLTEPKKGWESILNAAKIKDFRLQDLRRTLGSWQARTGASLPIIGKSLNHKSPTSTAIYARLDLDPVRASVDKAVGAMLNAGKIRSIKKFIKTTNKNKALEKAASE